MQTDTAPTSNHSDSDRRRHQRMYIRLPVECRMEAGNAGLVVRTLTQNISTGGMYLALDSADFQVGDRLSVELTIPARDGVSPYPGRANCTAEVLRVQPITPGATPNDATHPPGHVGIATRFLDRLRISY